MRVEPWSRRNLPAPGYLFASRNTKFPQRIRANGTLRRIRILTELSRLLVELCLVTFLQQGQPIWALGDYIPLREGVQ